MRNCRGRNDHNATLKYCRRYLEGKDFDVIELDDEFGVVEIQHAWIGNEYWFWNPPPGADEDSVKFKYSICDFLGALDLPSKKVLFGEEFDMHIVAHFFVRLPGTYDHKRPHNAKTTKSTYYQCDGETKDGKSGFAFVRNDGAILLCCPARNQKKMNAYWYSEQLLSALSVKKTVADLRDGMGGTAGAGTFQQLDKRCTLRGFSFVADTDVTYVPFSSNHGDRWGEGPPDTWWPTEWDPNTNKLKEISAEERTKRLNNAMTKSAKNKKCNLEFFETEAESVPVQTPGGSMPDGTPATASSFSAQAGRAPAHGVTHGTRATPTPQDGGQGCVPWLTMKSLPKKTKPQPALTPPQRKPSPVTLEVDAVVFAPFKGRVPSKDGSPQQTTPDVNAAPDVNRGQPTAGGPPPQPPAVNAAPGANGGKPTAGGPPPYLGRVPKYLHSSELSTL